jgi:rhodanese-related sulfurtransferase
MNPQAVAERLKQPKGSLILLDVRTPGEWTHDGRIDGATLIPIEEIHLRSAELPKDAEIIVYCHTGSRSNAVANYLAKIGYSNIGDMAGGIEAWLWAGLPVVRG